MHTLRSSARSARRPLRLLLALAGLAGLAGAAPQQVLPAPGAAVVLEGNRRLWQPLELRFTASAATDELLHAVGANPFLDRRLTVTFTHPVSGATRVVPGFFDADGASADTSATGGRVWRARFAPDHTGTWLWSASFRAGAGIALERAAPGTPADARLDGAFGAFHVRAADPAAPGFLATGPLEYVEAPYFRFAGSGEDYLKSGFGGPENFLGYFELDGTTGDPASACLSGDHLHHYAPHAGDYVNDAVGQAHLWASGTKGQNLLGAIDYLASVGVNSLYFITDNIQGDGRDVWPWVQQYDKAHFDVSRLAQWERVFAHLTQRGLQLQFVLEEQENDHLPVPNGGLGVGLTPERKLYYREMVARFAHHPAVIWVIGDESNYWDEVEDMQSLAAEIRALDPYRHPIAFHSKHPCPGCTPVIPSIVAQYAPYFAFEAFEATAFQTAPGGYNQSTIQLREAQVGSRPWSHYGDEQSLNAIPTNLTVNRTRALWGCLMGGGAGIAWYPGNHSSQYPPEIDVCDYFDLSIEDFRLLEDYFLQTSIAVELFRNELPFTEMVADNALASVVGSSDYVFMRPEDAGQGIRAVYAVYRGTGSATNLTLGPGPHTVEWWNPRTGAGPIAAPSLVGPGSIALPPPAQDPGQDWLAIVRQQ